MTGATPNVKFIDLTQDFSLHTPAFAGYAGPAIRWTKRLAFDKAGGQEITMTMHVTTHLDAPAHFLSGGSISSAGRRTPSSASRESTSSSSIPATTGITRRTGPTAHRSTRPNTSSATQGRPALSRNGC